MNSGLLQVIYFLLNLGVVAIVIWGVQAVIAMIKMPDPVKSFAYVILGIIALAYILTLLGIINLGIDFPQFRIK